MLDQFTEYFLNFKSKEIRFNITFMNFLAYKEFNYTEQLLTFLTPSSRKKGRKMVCRCRDFKYKIIEFPRSTESGGMVKSEVIVTEPV